METAFTKVVTDSCGFDYLLIEGLILKFEAPQDKNNEMVDIVSRALRGERSGLCNTISGPREQVVGG